MFETDESNVYKKRVPNFKIVFTYYKTFNVDIYWEWKNVLPSMDANFPAMFIDLSSDDFN